MGGSAPRVPSPRKPTRYGSHGCRAAPVPRESGRWLRHSIPFQRSGALWQNHCMPPRSPVRHPRGGMLPPCPLPCLAPSRPPKGGSPTRARTTRSAGVRFRAHGAPLPISSYKYAAPALLVVRALPALVCTGSCALGLISPTAQDALTEYNFVSYLNQ